MAVQSTGNPHGGVGVASCACTKPHPEKEGLSTTLVRVRGGHQPLRRNRYCPTSSFVPLNSPWTHVKINLTDTLPHTCPSSLQPAATWVRRHQDRSGVLIATERRAAQKLSPPTTATGAIVAR